MWLKKILENEKEIVYEVNMLPFFGFLILMFILVSLHSYSDVFLIIAFALFIGIVAISFIRWLPLYYKWVFKGYKMQIGGQEGVEFKFPLAGKLKIVLKKPAN